MRGYFYVVEKCNVYNSLSGVGKSTKEISVTIGDFLLHISAEFELKSISDI
jgi:hypothetical protein